MGTENLALSAALRRRAYPVYACLTLYAETTNRFTLRIPIVVSSMIYEFGDMDVISLFMCLINIEIPSWPFPAVRWTRNNRAKNTYLNIYTYSQKVSWLLSTPVRCTY